MNNNKIFQHTVSILLISGILVLYNFLAATGTFAGLSSGKTDKSVPSVSVDEAKSRLGKKDAVFLDVREPYEYASGHIPGAINIPTRLLESKISKFIPDRNKSIVVYCRTGRRSEAGTLIMIKLGYKNAVNMTGGILEWKKKGFPVE